MSFSFCQKLKRIRKTYHYSQEEMARNLGISRGHYSNLETGKMSPSDTVLICLSLLFHLPKNYLVDDENNETSMIDIGYQKFLLYSQNSEITEELLNTFCHLNKDYQEFVLLSSNALLDMQNKHYD